MPEPTPTPTPTPAPTPTPPADPAPTPPADPAPDDDTFVSDRQRRRFAELTGRVGTRERERDAALARVERLLTREAERVASTSLSQPSDLWLTGTHVADLLTDDGADVDPAKITAIIDGLVAQRPGLRKQPEPRPLSGIHGVGGQIPERSTLADAMRRIASGRGGV